MSGTGTAGSSSIVLYLHWLALAVVVVLAHCCCSQGEREGFSTFPEGNFLPPPLSAVAALSFLAKLARLLSLFPARRRCGSSSPVLWVIPLLPSSQRRTCRDFCTIGSCTRTREQPTALHTTSTTTSTPVDWNCFATGCASGGRRWINVGPLRRRER